LYFGVFVRFCRFTVMANITFAKRRDFWWVPLEKGRAVLFN
jgi:hypothetical protein